MSPDQADQISTLRNLMQAAREILTISQPAIVADGLYTRTQLEQQLRVSNVTFSAWMEFNDLRGFKPGTKERYFLGSDIIDWMRKHQDGIRKPRSTHEKTETRKHRQPAAASGVSAVPKRKVLK